MTKKRRAALIELLRCGADCHNMYTAYGEIYGGDYDLSTPLLCEAYDLAESTCADNGIRADYVRGLLEAARRLEEQS